MNLVEEYQRQYRFREWEIVYSLMPRFKGMNVLDLGCGIGSNARDFFDMGMNVTAIDNNEELISWARDYSDPKINFIKGDIASLASLNLPQFDLIWSSYASAYFTDFEKVLASWCLYLKPGGFVALIEASNIMAHKPMDERAQKVVQKLYEEALTKGRYDFNMGAKLKSVTEKLGLEIIAAQTIPDRELCFSGPATSGVLDAWKKRLARLKTLEEICGENYSAFKMRFMASLIDEGHKSLGEVHFILARNPVKHKN